MNDSELLKSYAETRSEADFTELVQRHIDLVYSAALRQVGGDAHLAQDVTQTVFVDLARKAASLTKHSVLGGWLYTSTRFAASKMVRTEQRRQTREQEAYSMDELLREAAPEPSWDQIRPVLDEAMHELGENERNAVLLRYFEGRQLTEVGARLGLSEDAARKRVGRALEKLRGILTRRGVSSSTAALAAVFAANAVSAAPAGLAVNIAGAAVATAATTTGTTLTVLKIMGMTKLKLGIVSAVVVATVATPLVMQYRSQLKLRDANELLQRQNQTLTAQVQPLAEENQLLSNLLARATAPELAAQSNPSNELLKLRGEVARLRGDSHELTRLKTAGSNPMNDAEIDTVAKGLASRATQLRQRLDQMPEKKIPELQFLVQNDWLNAVSEFKQLETDEEFRQAMSGLRSRAKGKFVSQMQEALRKFGEANGGIAPTELSQLQPFLSSPVDASILQRYQLVGSGKLNSVSIDEIAPPADDEYDTHFSFSINSSSSNSVNKNETALETAAVAFATANNGLLPRQAAQVTPYLQQPLDPNLVQEYLNKVPSNITTLDQLRAGRK